MLYKPHYIINNSDHLASIADEQTTGFIYLIKLDASKPGDIKHIARIIFEKNINEFCLLLIGKIPTSDLKPVFEDIIAMSFHYSYLRHDLNELVIYVENEDPELQRFVKNEAVSHGYDHVDLRGFQTGVPGATDENNIIFISDTENIEQQYYNYLLTSTAPAIQPVISLNGQATALPPSRLKVIFNRAELMLKANQPSIYHLLEFAKKARKSNEILKRQLAYYEEALDARKSYAGVYTVSDTVYRKKITDIAEFYHYEYEILPGWFKKLGHIIKAVMGKRTWQSLYDDNVKKYKK